MAEPNTYVRWTPADIRGLQFAELLTEISPTGVVLREIGLDSNGSVVHRAPTASERGLFDNQGVDLSRGIGDDFSLEHFDRLWG